MAQPLSKLDKQGRERYQPYVAGGGQLASGSGSGAITVEEEDGSPSVTGVTVLQFHQDDGFVVTNPAGATARVDLSAVPQARIADLETNITELGVVSLNFIIDGGGSVITTGIKGDVEIPFGCTITRVTLLADQSGSIVIDIWKDTYANYPPTDADSITASAPPTISSAIKSQDATLTGWTTSIGAGDTLRFNVDSITTITRVTVSLKLAKTLT